MNRPSVVQEENLALFTDPLLRKAGTALAVAAVLPIRSPLEKKMNSCLKRGIDLFVSSLLIVLLLSWITPVLALLIAIDSRGPVFFLQKRNKRNGRVFTCIKFRTMVVNDTADTLAACRNDKRITRIGRILRRTHLDELPQLLNVWWGDMSLIGPRPYMVQDNIRYQGMVEHYGVRHRVKPGITGLAQSLGHHGSLLDVQKMKERVEIDLHYIHHWSVAMDVRIICRTLLMMAGRKDGGKGIGN
ncbi:MAG TPA: sugar transferase [Flavisolibacter sp.]|jgi:putative colanic acid biosynthesis UDP-glucose lipid carrier transferase